MEGHTTPLHRECDTGNAGVSCSCAVPPVSFAMLVDNNSKVPEVVFSNRLCWCSCAGRAAVRCCSGQNYGSSKGHPWTSGDSLVVAVWWLCCESVCRYVAPWQRHHCCQNHQRTRGCFCVGKAYLNCSRCIPVHLHICCPHSGGLMAIQPEDHATLTHH